MKAIIKLLTVMLLVLYAQAAFAPPPSTITSCGTDITSSGTYLVDEDLAYSDSPGGDCIDITAVNVTLDCQGYWLDGTGSGTYNGIHASTSADGVWIKNCDVEGWDNGIYIQSEAYENAVGLPGLIEWNKVVDNNYGIYLNGAYGNGTTYGNIVRWNRVYDNSRGIYVASSDYNDVQDNKVVDNSYGIFVSSADFNDVRWNKGDDNYRGIYLAVADDNDIFQNTMHRGRYGINCNSGQRNYIDENQFNRNTSSTGYGLYISSCDNGWIRHNTSNGNDYGMYVGSGADGNEMRKNVLNRNKNYGIYDSGGTGTDNSYYDNVCKNNTTNSWPSGLCKN